VILAELEVFHSRAYSPTRRLALGRVELPVDPPPGFGPLLLGGIVAVGAEELDEEDRDALRDLLHQIEQGRRIVQPRLRNRFQADRQGLARTVARLVGGGEQLEYDFDGNGSPLQMALAASYAVGTLPLAVRPLVAGVVRKGLDWRGEIGPRLITHLSGPGGTPNWSTAGLDPLTWALAVFGFDGSEPTGRKGHGPPRREIQRRFRSLLREAHPDHGGEALAAADRIAELAEARRILLG
jgi:hypothetical protein